MIRHFPLNALEQRITVFNHSSNFRFVFQAFPRLLMELSIEMRQREAYQRIKTGLDL